MLRAQECWQDYVRLVENENLHDALETKNMELPKLLNAFICDGGQTGLRGKKFVQEGNLFLNTPDGHVL